MAQGLSSRPCSAGAGCEIRPWYCDFMVLYSILPAIKGMMLRIAVANYPLIAVRNSATGLAPLLLFIFFFYFDFRSSIPFAFPAATHTISRTPTTLRLRLIYTKRN